MVEQGMADNPMNVLLVPSSPLPVEVSLIQAVGITNLVFHVETASGINMGISWPQRLQRIYTTLSPTRYVISAHF